MTLIAEYKNGNYSVRLFDDGTRVMRTDDEVFSAVFPDNIDLKITDYCDGNCPMCHESSTVNGMHATFDATFLNHLHKGTELAIGGGDPFSHPDLESFLRRMNKIGVVCNLTVNERHLPRYVETIRRFWKEGLLHGLGVSVSDLTDFTLEFAAAHPNTVLHAICGVMPANKLLATKSDNLKLLILGYKLHGRGKTYFSDGVLRSIADFSKHLPDLCQKFDVVSFDNPALEQLHVQRRVSSQTWKRFFCGKDGSSNLYIDLVRGVFAVSSRSDEVFPLMSTAEQMLDFIHKRYL